VQAVVLVGGEGTRLRPLTLTQPKPAIRLVDRSFIAFMVDWLGSHGVSEVVMACGFRAEDLRTALGDREGGVEITYVQEPEPLGTGGPLRLAADRGLLGDRFLAFNGDVLTDLDLGALIRTHEERGAAATLALYPVSDASGYGLVRRAGGPEALGEAPTAADGEVVEFVEKPDPDQIRTDEISAGAYVLERSVLDLVPAGRAVSIEREVFPRLVGSGLYGRRLEGYWMDIGTPERYLQASWDILERRVATETGERLDAAGYLVEEGATIEPAARVSAPALVETGCVAEAGATIGPRVVLGAGTVVEPGASLRGAVLDSSCRVGADAHVEGAILAARVVVGAGARIGSGAVIGEGANIESGAEVAPNGRVQPGETVSA